MEKPFQPFSTLFKNRSFHKLASGTLQKKKFENTRLYQISEDSPSNQRAFLTVLAEAKEDEEPLPSARAIEEPKLLLAFNG